MVLFLGIMTIVILPIFLCMGYIIVEFLIGEKKDAVGYFIASLIPIINWVMWVLLDVDPDLKNLKELQCYFNWVKRCHSCGINSRYGRTLIHHKFNGEREICPFCQSENLYDVNETAPLSKPLSKLDSIKLQSKINKVNNIGIDESDMIFKDSQLEKYQKLQEIKLKEMLEYKNNL